ncbi:DUF1330 domain-containing protein [Bradyrhizobium sp. 1(2017)]|uniref:DUF1330 domain-containing protein n=1 Tax=Bradyrhizobium sp. 1(2017) TaxID=1404888 RepID=UPI00140EE408|nr:DUF1330 domain-containing protein [Bradyrhizobium sp. 1(2017)]
MPAYFVVRGVIHDRTAFQDYAARSPAVLASFGGRHIARGGKTIVFEGAADRAHVVVAEFPDFDAAERCYRSDAYQSILPLRRDSATLEFVLVDGVSSEKK